MEPVIIVVTASDFSKLVAELAHHRHIAIDTESNGFYAYYERICLIQISTADNDYIVDPLALGDISPLRSILANPQIEKILHAASNDITGLKRDFQFQICNLFDTAIACKLLGFQQLGLSPIIRQFYGAELNKKWQRCDWGKRPLSPEQLNYARLDTHFLIDLRHQLAASLEAKQLWQQAQEMFVKACEQELHPRFFNPLGYKRIRGSRLLDRAGKRILRALYQYRDQCAQQQDRAPFRVLSNEALLRMAGSRPNTLQDLAKIRGLSRSYRNGRAARELLHIIQSNLKEPERLPAAGSAAGQEAAKAPTISR